ncbi:MAG: DUF3788 domain-containing protein [Anaerotruncus sp.]|nr:DUF3788 domain-containing protein [Anaerotruncus sp.]
MKWNESYPQNKQPTLAQIAEYIQSPFWNTFCQFIETGYQVTPSIEYSKCSLEPGWNVKYKKSGKALCTLYIHEGYFTCMLSISGQQAPEAEALLPLCDPYLQTLYQNTKPLNGGRWLMANVTSETILENLKELLQIRVPLPKKKM